MGDRTALQLMPLLLGKAWRSAREAYDTQHVDDPIIPWPTADESPE